MASADVETPRSAGGLDVDVSRLSGFLQVPDETIVSFAALQEEHVTTFLRAVYQKARDYDDLRADKLRVDVELEQAVRSADTRVKSMKTQLDSALSETQSMRLKMSSTDTARIAIENELLTYRTSQTTVDEEIRVLRTRVQALESDKRDTLEALDRKSNDYDTLQDEYTSAQAKVIEIRREISSLETQLQQAQSAQTSSKFREQSLSQEVELLRKNNDWLDNELKTKVAEYQKFRKEKAAQLSTLRSELDDAISNVEMTQRSNEGLKQRNEELAKKAEDRLTKIKDLQAKIVSQEESFRTEMSSQQRLAELYEQSTKSARARVTELEQLLEQEHERESIEIGQAQAMLETERAERQAAENKVMELEIQNERLEGDLSAYASGAIVPARAGSPGGVNGNGTPIRRPGSAMGSPASNFMSPAAGRLKGGMSVTQLYSDFNQTKAAYDQEKRRNAKLEEAIEELMADLEQKAPEIQELRDEHERLQTEMVGMSTLLEEAAKDRDAARKQVRKTEGKIDEYEREATILRKQLRDLSTQIQILLVEMDQRDAGVEQLTPAQNRLYEQIISGEIIIEGETDTDRLISQRLTVFRTVQEMQEQNQHLLRAVRELGQKMENEEAERQKDLQTQQNEEIKGLVSNTERLRDELNAMATKCQSFARERDMFRRMLQNKGEAPREDGGNRRATIGVPASEAGLITAQEFQHGLSEAIKELQSQYDQFKSEAHVNHSTLNEQARRLASEKSELEVQIARVNSQLELAGERYEMLNGNFNMVKNENKELQSRLSSMHEAQARLDMRAQQVEEELVDSKNILDSLRNENANLKAEKSLWKNIEQRLSQDNESLTQERARLNSQITNLHAIQNERERGDAENRRRLVSQVEKLENELQSTKRRLNEEIEESKKTNIRKEFDARETQRRIDELNTKLSNTREELVAAKTSQDHLQTRVDELTSELKAAEDKLSVYTAKPAESAPTAPEGEFDDENLSHEQQLQIEVVDLKRSLELANSEIGNLNEQVAQYKQIAASSEEELQNMNDTHDAFKESMDQKVAEQEDQIRDLEQRVQDLNTELESSSQELSQIRQQEAEQQRQFQEEKELLDSRIKLLEEDMEKSAAAASFYQEDLRQQAGIAQEAQQNYERELVKHAEAAKALGEIRAEYAQLKSQIYQARTEAETAKESLSNSEASWETQRENYTKEISDLGTRCDDLVKQNKILLGQLDAVSEQVSTMQKSRAIADEANEGSPDPNALADKNTEALREVIRYLRREKEIVDVQFSITTQESIRLKQQLDYTRNMLEETRLQLSQERQRETDQLRNSTQHKDLMERLSELNILRESNSTLRSDGEKKGKKVQELQSKVEELQSKIDPLEEQVRSLEAEKEVINGQYKLLEADNEMWKARANNVMTKYCRIDPAELEALQENVKKAEEERESLREQLAAVEASKNAELENSANKWREAHDKFTQNSKTKLAKYRQDFEEKKGALDKEVGELKAELANVQTAGSGELQALQQEKSRLEEEAKALQLRATKAEAEREAHRAKGSAIHKELGAHKKTLAEIRAELDAVKAELETTKSELEAVKAREQALLSQQTGASNVSDTMVDNTATIKAEVDRQVEAAIENLEADYQKRVEEALQNGPSAVDPMFVEEEVQRRLAAVQEAQQVQQPGQVFDPDTIEAEVQRRLAEALPPAVEAEVAKRLAEQQPSTDTSADIEAEVTKRVEAVQANLESVIEERVKQRTADLEVKKNDIETRIKEARANFQEYKKKAVRAAVDEKTAEYETIVKEKDAQREKIVEEFQQQISKLKLEIEELRSQLAEAMANAGTAVATDGDDKHRLALETKESEHQEALAKAKADYDSRLAEIKEELRDEVRAEYGAEFAVQEAVKHDQDLDANERLMKERNRLKQIIKSNVEHRLPREKQKWESEVKAEVQKTPVKQEDAPIDNAAMEQLQQKVQELEAKIKELEAAIAEKDRVIQAKEAGFEEMHKKREEELTNNINATLEKQKDALRQEGAARIKVQLNMMEKKVKNLEEKLKNQEGGKAQATPPPVAAQPVTTQTLPGQLPQQPPTGLRRPSQVGSIPQPIQSISAQDQAANNANNARRGENAGTGPAALRSLRGALGSNIPRGGAVGRGMAGRGQPPGSESSSPQQQQLQMQQPFASQIPQNPFAGQIPMQQQTGIPNPFAPQQAQQQQQQQQQQQRFTGIPRGGAMARGRGNIRGGAMSQGNSPQHQQLHPQQQQGLGIQTGMPGIPMMQQGQQSPGSAGARNMNPSAKQFVPHKRARDEAGGDNTQDSGHQQQGKRIRGGHQG